MNKEAYKYFAFISYNAKDTAWGKRLQRKLEHYRMPATLCSERGWKRKPMDPVFFAPTDIQPGGLTEELQERLRTSRNLIVICSPHSAKSEWVGKEIAYFHSLGRTKQIHFFIVDGVPHSNDEETECFNPVIKKLGLPEILGANIHERIYRWPWLNKERAYVQLISKLLGVEFDTIWQRHKRRLIRNTILWLCLAATVIAALFFVWRSNQPVDVKVQLEEATAKNDNLPPLRDAVVTMTLANESKTDTLRSLDQSPITFANIPHKYLNQKVRATVVCADYLDLDTTFVLTRDVVLRINRNPKIYGDLKFELWRPSTETTLPNTKVTIEGQEVTSDANGKVAYTMPLHLQRLVYHVSIAAPYQLEVDSLYMPCTESSALIVK